MTQPGYNRVRVWDPLIRILHWSLAASVLAAWWTREGFGRTHEWIGYLPLAVVLIRVLWGLVSRGHGRFSSFIVSPAKTARYASDLARNKAARYAGHNPLAGWMTLTLLIMVSAVAVTGWLYTTDRYWGIDWVIQLHDRLTDVLLIFIGLHITAAIFMSFKDRQNLVSAMIHGRKLPAENRQEHG